MSEQKMMYLGYQITFRNGFYYVFAINDNVIRSLDEAKKLIELVRKT